MFGTSAAVDVPTQGLHVGSGQTKATLDVTDVAVEVVHDAAVGRVRQAVDHLHHRLTHVIKVQSSGAPLGRLETGRRSMHMEVLLERPVPEEQDSPPLRCGS